MRRGHVNSHYPYLLRSVDHDYVNTVVNNNVNTAAMLTQHYSYLSLMDFQSDGSIAECSTGYYLACFIPSPGTVTETTSLPPPFISVHRPSVRPEFEGSEFPGETLGICPWNLSNIPAGGSDSRGRSLMFERKLRSHKLGTNARRTHVLD